MEKEFKPREFDISLFTAFTADSIEELQEKTKDAHLDGYQSVSGAVKIEVSKLREDLQDGYLQVFGKLRK
jgi:hypothetical protein